MCYLSSRIQTVLETITVYSLFLYFQSESKQSMHLSTLKTLDNINIPPWNKVLL